VLAGQAAVIRAPADRPVGLGEDLERLAAHSVQGPAEHLLGPGPRVDVRGVKGRDALIERRGHARGRRRLLDLRAVCDPVAVGDRTDLQPAAAEMTIFHGIGPSDPGTGDGAGAPPGWAGRRAAGWRAAGWRAAGRRAAGWRAAGWRHAGRQAAGAGAWVRSC